MRRVHKPRASVIIPCRNEGHTIEPLLDALFKQTFPLEDMEIVVADGMSIDQTRGKIKSFKASHHRMALRVIDNRKLNTPSGLNQAIKVSRGEFIIRMDAHSIPNSDYVQRCVDALVANRGDVVGGVWIPTPAKRGIIAKSIAKAIVHPLSVGDAVHRYSKKPRFVETVSFGALRRSTMNKVGPFNEDLLANQDYELNSRVRKMGGRIWLDPGIKFKYIIKPGLKNLARQYARYGFWKAQMLKKYPTTLRWRHLLPPLFVVSILGLMILGFFWGTAHIILISTLSVYLLILLAAGGLAVLRERDLPLFWGVPLAIATIHLCWGSALLWGLTTKNLKLPPLPG